MVDSTPTPYYTDDSVTLYHGDCLKIAAWLAADVLVTDPPYGTAYRSGWSSISDRRVVNKPADVVKVRGDENVGIRNAALELWGDGPAVIFGVWRVPRPAATRQRLIWHKRNTNPGMRAETAGWFAADEEIYVLGSGFGGSPAQSVIPTDEYRASAHGQAALIGHPTPKPIRLMEHLIERCPPGTIADPFEAGWDTQQRSRVPWVDVPEANKAAMRAAVRALLAEVGGAA